MPIAVASALKFCSTLRIVEDLIGREQHHRGLEEVVVEGTEELGDEKRHEPALFQQAERIEHDGKRPHMWQNRGNA